MVIHMLLKYEVNLVKGVLDLQRLPTTCQAFSLFALRKHREHEILSNVHLNSLTLSYRGKMPDVKQHTCSLNDATTTYIFNEKNMYKERKGFKLSQKLMQDGNEKN